MDCLLMLRFWNLEISGCGETHEDAAPLFSNLVLSFYLSPLTVFSMLVESSHSLHHY